MYTQAIAGNEVSFPRETSKKRIWAGWIVSVLPALFLLSGGINTARKADFVLQGLTHLGYPGSVAVGLGIFVFACSVLYLVPRTAVFGAMLLTAYLGGATASHVRIGEAFFPPIVFALLLWAGVFLRDRRVAAFLFGNQSEQ
jgi:DoxX-like family